MAKEAEEIWSHSSLLRIDYVYEKESEERTSRLSIRLCDIRASNKRKVIRLTMTNTRIKPTAAAVANLVFFFFIALDSVWSAKKYSLLRRAFVLVSTATANNDE